MPIAIACLIPCILNVIKPKQIYIVKDKHLILKSSNNGMFVVSMKALPELMKEIMEVHDVYGK